ncbi:hypothetical protein KM043_011838 [Ampulex compressa]|nr:hypothetical protein KM043_011838 [Ampulex compressa]
MIIADYIHTNKPLLQSNKKDGKSSLVPYHFKNVERKEKETFLEVLQTYEKDHTIRQGHVEFINTALKYMEEFGVHKDLEIYKNLINVLPKGKYIPTNVYQTMFQHYSSQQQIIVDLLCQMEHYCVMPDREMEDILLNIFGMHGLPLKKYWRMIYWMPKFSELNPWPVPRPPPTDPRELARLAMKKIGSADVQNIISEFETKNVEDSMDDTWIISSMSQVQEKLLIRHDRTKPLFVEGPFIVWVGNYSVDYFVLRSDEIRNEGPMEDTDDVTNIKIPFWEEKQIALQLTVHEQNDGIYYAMCASGMSSKDSLLSWIQCLQIKNPILREIPIVFKLKSSTEALQQIEECTTKNQPMETNKESTKMPTD